VRASATEHEFTMTDGRVTIGTILQAGRSYRALASDGRWLGTFPSLKEAAREISRSQGGRADA
jgi:hypothetical protein